MNQPQSYHEGINRPLPQPGEVFRTAIPDSFDGIRFGIGRLFKYIQDGRRDPVVITTAQQVAQLSADTARQLGRKETPENRSLIWLEGLHAWCHGHFEHISSPANTDLLKTPGRMLRELEVPEAISRAMWEPIRDAMAKAAGKKPESLTLPKPKIAGTSAMAACLLLTMAAALDITPIKMRFGGADGTLYYIWGRVHADDKWRDVDILLPKFGEHRKFDHYEEIEVPV